MTPNAITNRYGYLCARLGIVSHFHALRHYYASTLIACGVPSLYAQRMMGHASMAMINRVYGHVMADEQKKIDARVNDRLVDLVSV